MIFNLNGKEYETKEVTFGEVIKMERCGVNFNAIDSKSFTQALAMIVYITKLSIDKVQREIDEHLEKGGNIEDIFKCFEVLTESDFFKKVGAK